MDNEIVLEAEKLVERLKLKYPQFVGRTAKESDILELERKLKLKLPDWYHELYVNVPIIGAEFGFQEFQAEYDFDGVSYIIWEDLESIFQECMEYAPGMFVNEKEYIFVASCSHGSGDPIFINLSSNDPQVVRIYHDDTDIVKVEDSLSKLFKNAII
ncbi:SMI1/KNR4 family protein [Paenibacillus sp. Soil750]|uniref:SMI1/KNR4 family protein n=1 Tax=Paenibacillus sp. Soil750 TaxID=1736398 RepID=UPI0006F67553|nr:SMI1/KNR4 family protein [Paenibacillus sp. Soil750]KRE61929.1 hypothetical protein ASL11_23775 [Paenibacillus sp. Soil750]